ncbi:olfactomedin-like protein 2B [Thamnophis elegans]|uniref:olfactomedin-like protein 2B n=1 Tax=Thamnophis elegans TaxID=35005 RepID=UPI001376E213|nr:olfactomedin-like protein 2B [Thamnophis elegans]
MPRPGMLLWCCAAALLAAWWGAADASPSSLPTGAPLEDEAENQENILSQLLGDYDKVKAVSQGSNCQCKCVVRPLGRGACQRINEGSFKAEDFYMVETITSGPECKCSCVAPPSALNPCEGDFRLKKLQEADNKDFKLAAVIEMLENAFYGLDLLKLHSVTTKLVGRVEKLEEKTSRNLTKDNKQKRQNAEESFQEVDIDSTINPSNSHADSQSSLQRDAAAAYTLPEEKYEDVFVHDETASRHLSSAESLHYALPATGAMNPKAVSPRKLHVRSRPPTQQNVVRGITYYKAKDAEIENDLEEPEEESFSGDTIDLLIEDQLLQHNYLSNVPSRKPPSMENLLLHDDVQLLKGVTSTTPSGKEMSESISTITESPLSSTGRVLPLESTPLTTSSVVSTTQVPETTATAEFPVTGAGYKKTAQTLKTLSQIATQAPTITTTAEQDTATMGLPIISTTTTDFHKEMTPEPTMIKTVASPASVNPSLTVTPEYSLDEEDIRNSIGECNDLDIQFSHSFNASDADINVIFSVYISYLQK